MNSVIKDKRSFVEYIAFILGDDYDIHFVGCEIYPQGFAAIVTHAAELKGTTMLCDIGNGTMNLMLLRNGKLDISRMWTVGKVVNNVYGRHLTETVRAAGIDLTGLLVDEKVHTTLAVVHTFENGNRDFSFYRDPGADMMLTCDELPMPLLGDCRIFHFGTLPMTHEGVRAATQAAVAAAKEAGALISFDPNLRPPLWSSEALAKSCIEWGLSQCDILKIADNELLFMTGESDFDRGAAILRRQYPNIRLLNVTAEAEGSYAYFGDLRVFVPAFTLGGTIETTGAGDTFCACVLHDVLTHGLAHRDAPSLQAMIRFANTAAYLVTTKKGAIRSMPTPAQIEGILAAQR